MSPIYCFVYDKSIVETLKNFHKHMKDATIGLIISQTSFNENDEKEIQMYIKSNIPDIDLSKVILKHGNTRFQNWNKGQHKLDIALFADEYSPIVWLNSTIRIFRDTSSLIDDFVKSEKKVGFLVDRLSNDTRFQKNWGENSIIPQNNFIVFNSIYVPSFFKLWESIWNEYVTPYPFAAYPNPAPFNTNSIYAIDQYALSKAVFKYIKSFESDVYVIERNELYAGDTIIEKKLQLENTFRTSPWCIPSSSSISVVVPKSLVLSPTPLHSDVSSDKKEGEEDKFPKSPVLALTPLHLASFDVSADIYGNKEGEPYKFEESNPLHLATLDISADIYGNKEGEPYEFK